MRTFKELVALPLSAPVFVPHGQVFDSRRHLVACCGNHRHSMDEQDTVATEIAKRVNLHDELVARIAQLEDALRKVEVVVKDSEVPAPDDVHDEEQWFNEAMKEADRVGDEVAKIVDECFA